MRNALQIFSRRIRLPDCARSEVKDLVTVVSNVSIELGNTGVSPITSNGGKNVTQGVRSVMKKVINPGGTLHWTRWKTGKVAYLVMVPSISEMTI